MSCDHGVVFVVSAPTGTGKTTLVDRLVREFPNVVASVSYTTRAPRAGEIPGQHYHFVSSEDFRRRIAAGEFIEYVQLYDQYYGTSRQWVEERLKQGQHVILTIDTQGARLLRGLIDAVFIFIAPPSIEELRRRLLDRRTEPEAAIEKRLAWVEHEMNASSEYDYCFVNDSLDVAYQVLRSVVIAEAHRVRS